MSRWLQNTGSTIPAQKLQTIAHNKDIPENKGQKDIHETNDKLYWQTKLRIWLAIWFGLSNHQPQNTIDKQLLQYPLTTEIVEQTV